MSDNPDFDRDAPGRSETPTGHLLEATQANLTVLPGGPGQGAATRPGPARRLLNALRRHVLRVGDAAVSKPAKLGVEGGVVVFLCIAKPPMAPFVIGLAAASIGLEKAIERLERHATAAARPPAPTEQQAAVAAVDRPDRPDRPPPLVRRITIAADGTVSTNWERAAAPLSARELSVWASGLSAAEGPLAAATGRTAMSLTLGLPAEAQIHGAAATRLGIGALHVVKLGADALVDPVAATLGLASAAHTAHEGLHHARHHGLAGRLLGPAKRSGHP